MLDRTENSLFKNGQFYSQGHLRIAENTSVCTELQIFLKSDLRVAVTHADRDDAGKHVQVTGSLVIVQPLHVALMNQQWLLVVSQVAGRHMTLPRLQNGLVARTLRE